MEWGPNLFVFHLALCFGRRAVFQCLSHPVRGAECPALGVSTLSCSCPNRCPPGLSVLYPLALLLLTVNSSSSPPRKPRGLISFFTINKTGSCPTTSLAPITVPTNKQSGLVNQIRAQSAYRKVHTRAHTQTCRRTRTHTHQWQGRDPLLTC